MLRSLRNIPLRYKFWLANAVSFAGMLILVLTFMMDLHKREQALPIPGTTSPATATQSASATAGQSPAAEAKSSEKQGSFTDLVLREAPFYAVLVAILMGAVLVVSQLLILFVQRPVEELGKAMHQVQHNGDPTQRVKVISSDEIGSMSQAFNAMQDTTQQIVEHMAQTASHLSGATERLTTVTSETREGMQRQQSEPDQVATAMNEMASTVTEVARNASQAEAVAQRSGDVASDGRAIVTQVIDAITALSDNISSSRQTIEELSEASATVSSVTDVIQGIAEQTNLLALNASIEAARSGEHGRGFAVVADEVRTLAQRTQQSTEEIRDIIERLASTSKHAMGVMERSCEQAESTVNRAGEAGEALAGIAQAVQEINEINALIATASEEQTAVAEEINRNLVAIRDAAHEALEGSNASAAESTELARLASGISDSTQRFKT